MRCKTCGGTGWVSLDLKSDTTHSKLIQMSIDCEVACTDCAAGRAELLASRTQASIDKMQATWDRDRRIIADRDCGLTLSAIGKKYGLSISRIRIIVTYYRNKPPPSKE